MRWDGTRVKARSPMYEIAPYIMPKRYDAQNFVNIQIDEDRIRDYLRSKRSQGLRMDHMTVLIAAYLRTCAQYPALNRFVMNRRIYQRKHFCVSFIVLKPKAEGAPGDTAVKVYLDFNDDIFTVNQKLQAAIQASTQAQTSTNFDNFVSFLISLPGLARFVVGTARLLDRYGLLPRKIIDLSPFHTSVFVSNLASINTNYIYHHLYEFGTTSIFIAMGKIIRDYRNNRDDRRIMPLGIVMDERIASGHDFSRMMTRLRKYLQDPTLLERPADEKIQEEAPEEAAVID